ncbi:MAG: DUF4199 domain-containing protein [Lacinutrix venerupis]
METTTKSSAVNFGLILGAILAGLTIIAYAVNLDLLTKWWFGIGILLLVIVLGILSSIKSKKLLNGFITFKEAFTSYFITVVVGLLISAVISIVIFNFVDPEAADLLKEKIMDSQVQTMRDWGAPEESVAAVVEEFEKQDNMYSVGNVLQSLLFQIIGFSIVGLISSLILKRNPENA